MFTAAIAPGKNDKKSPPPVAGIPDNVLNRVPFQKKNPIINSGKYATKCETTA